VSKGLILVVDDEEGIRILCRVNFELADYEVVEAGDGASAVEAAREHRPDLILLDVMMPAMDGWEVLHRLKADDITKNIPVVMLTARTSESDQLKAWGGGVLDFVEKPFDPSVLEELADRVLTGEADDIEEQERRQRIVEQLRSSQQRRRS
jgi:DNA-binding response OmpR family regulator